MQELEVPYFLLGSASSCKEVREAAKEVKCDALKIAMLSREMSS